MHTLPFLSRSRNQHGRSLTRCRPSVERLEQRLPPGDVLVGILTGWSLVGELDAPAPTDLSLRITRASVESETESNELAAPAEAPLPARIHRTVEDSAPATDQSSNERTLHQRAAGLVPAVRPAGINPAARQGIAEATAPISFPNSGSRTPVRETPFRRASGDQAEFPEGALPNGSSGTRAVRAGEYRTPFYFEQNVGQTDARVDFIARTGAGAMFVTPTALVMALPGQRSEVRDQRSEVGSQGSVFEAQHSALETQHSLPGAAIHMQIVGAKPQAAVGVNRHPGIVNYFIGDDPNQWHANIPTFSGVRYDDVYPGIDLAYYGNNGQMEYDFIVSPGADPNAITLNFAGADGVTINEHGGLVLHTPAGDIMQQKPFTYQEAGGTRQEVASGYVVNGMEVQFGVGAYDATRPLVIDPLVMGYSTYFGAPGNYGWEIGYAIKVDAAGSAYAAGKTDAVQKFPTTPGAFQSESGGNTDAFVTKLNPAGSDLVFATYLGGSSYDDAEAIVLDADGNAYMTGETCSANFPTTNDAYDTSKNGTCDAFVTKLRSDGAALFYSTFIGGSNGHDYGVSITVDASHQASVAGDTDSNDFPTTPGAFDTSYNAGNPYGDTFVSKFSSDGSTLVFSTFLGGNGSDLNEGLDVDPTGNIYVTGWSSSTNFPTTPGAYQTVNAGGDDAYIVKLRPDGAGLLYSTLLGGNDHECCSQDIVVDADGHAYVTGLTYSDNFPTTPGVYDPIGPGLYAAKLTPNGSALVFSTYAPCGGSGIDVDASGNVYLSGSTSNTNLETTSDAFDSTYNGGSSDACLLALRADGAGLLYSTYLGGSESDLAHDIAVSDSGDVFLFGQTGSTNFPTTPGAFKRRNRGNHDAFVTKFAKV